MLIHWLFATIRAMVAAFGKKHRRLAIEIAFGFGRAQTAALERLRALESLLAQDEYGKPVLYEGHQVVACEYKPDEGAYPGCPYLVTCVNAAWRVSIKRGLAAGLLTEYWSEEAGTELRKKDFVPAVCGIRRLIGEEELQELRLMQFAHRLAEGAGILKGAVSYLEDGTEVVTRKSKPHSRGEATDRELWQERHTVSEDDGHERQHYLLNERLTNRTVETQQRNLIYREGPKGALHEAEEDYGVCPRDTGRDEADVDREAGYAAFHDHEGYDGVVPLRAATRKENATRERARYRLGWEMRFAGLKPDGYFGTASIPYTGRDDWKTPKVLGLRLQFVPKGESRSVQYWEKDRIPVEFLTLHDLVEKTDRTGKTYKAAGSLLLADGSREPGVIRAALSDKETRKAVKVKPAFKAELEAMLRGIVEGKAFDAIEFVRKDMGYWTRGVDGKPYNHGVLVMPCKTCLLKAAKAEDSSERAALTKDAQERVWRSDVHADYCPICGQQMWQVKCRLFAKTKLLPFVDWEASGFVAEYFTFEIYGDLVKDMLFEYGRAHGGRAEFKPKPSRKKVRSESRRARELRELKCGIVNRMKARGREDAYHAKRIEADRLAYMLAHPEAVERA